MPIDIEDIIRAIRLKDYTVFDGPIIRNVFYIDGIEITQAIQYYKSSRHLTDVNDQQPDNSVRLVAGKAAWVRVHLASAFAVSSIGGITGTLDVLRQGALPFLYLPVATLAAQPPGKATAAGPSVSYAARRGSLAYSLNFIIPADQMCGRLRLIAHVNGPYGGTETMTIEVDATLRQTLRVAGIRIGYNGPASSAPNAPNLTLAAPTTNDVTATSAWTLTTFPVENTAVYRNAGVITWNLPLTDAPSCPGCCTPNWVALNTAVQAQRVADGNRTDFLYYGLMANGIPIGPIVGCNSGGVSTGANGDGVTMAHELGHACGFAHAPCGTPGDPNYPAYEPYDPANTPMASIGEYGLNINDGSILPPDTFKDFMSYCWPKWISLYNYRRLINHASLHPTLTCVPRPPWWENWEEYVPVWPPQKWLPDPPPDVRVIQEVFVNPEPVISIIGVVQSENEIEIHSLMRLNAVPEVSSGQRTELTAHLIGENGTSVARAALYRLRSQGSGCGCGCDGQDSSSEPTYPYVFQSFVPDNQPGAALRITSSEREIWERKRTESEPKIGGLEAYVTFDDRNNGYSLQLASPAESSSEYGIVRWYQWSNDDGQNWYALTTGATEDKIVIDAGSLPEGPIQVRALVSDGFFTTTSDTVNVEMPRRAPDAAILAPRDQARIVAGNTMRLWGSASVDANTNPDYITWFIDGQPVANGLDVFITAPEAGEHRLTFSVRSDSGETNVERTFVTYAVEQSTE